MIAAAATFLLSNFYLVMAAIALAVWMAKVRRARASRRPFSSAAILWAELLFYVYGIGSIYGGLFHAYDGEMIAKSIGWQNSPFQYELGWFEIGYGFVACMSLWRGYAFRLAMTLPYSIFLLADAAQHFTMMVTVHDYAPNNTGLLLWVGDIAIPLLMLLLAWLSRDAEETRY